MLNLLFNTGFFQVNNKIEINPIQDGGEGAGRQKGPPYQFFPCNFDKWRNYPQKLSDF